ncbi:arabinose efflux permease family protein [Terriglobus roseus DSM 18391]|uniref:Arabinose efflux permease family protein n=1 Tax=Terriglobus roseus (strain DSM 18391 / NRRL B-41598 / KBS 63) TaxID=926566 RepID=I3ZFU3_TERRK|nr:MFS transporter [Terriglobus roseus]AFL88111.1 arabinose efflux permease family protein [Terriglobus roseus DSM 18391]
MKPDSSNPAKQTDPSTLRGHALAVALLAAGALFMENLDATIIATGLPTMARDFGTTAIAVNVGITAYLLTLAIFIPVSGWVATRFGERRVFASAILIFTVASAMCGLSHTLPLFTASRVLQGIGGSMMVPVGRLMVLRASTQAQLMKAIAYTIWPALVAPILGPPVGGWILSFASWPWMFLVNVPIGIVLFFFVMKVVPPDLETRRESFDVPGFLLAGGASFCLMYLLESMQVTPLPVVKLTVIAVLAAVLSLGAVRWMRVAREPLFRPEVWKIDTFRVNNGAGAFFRMAVYSVPFLLPLLFQEAFGLNPLQSGSLTMAVFAGNLAMKPLTAPLLRRYGFRQVLIVNGFLTVVLLAACGWLRADSPRLLVLAVLFFGGLARSMELTSLTTIGYADLPRDLKATGTTLTTTINQLTTSLGVAVSALALHISASMRGGVSAFDFRVAFCVMAVFAAASMPAYFRLHPDAGAEVSGAAIRQEREATPAEG